MKFCRNYARNVDLSADYVRSTPGSRPFGYMLREKPFTIGVKVVRHGRYVTLQMAEVVILKTLFVEILCLIDRLRPALLPS